MKIAVIGATGASGKHFVQQALENGHEVTALVRTEGKLDAHPQLRTVVGDALNPDNVRETLDSQDAVFCALGAGGNTGKTTIRQAGTQQIIEALAALDQQPHLVILSSLGVGESKKQMSWLVRQFILFILRNPLADHEAQEALVRGSDLPWTLIRPTSLNDDVPTDNLRITQPPEPVNAREAVPRADVAAFALKVIEERQYLHESVTLTAQPQ